MANTVLKHLKDLQEVSSSPFHPYPYAKNIKDFLEKRNIPYTENLYQIIVNPNPKPKAPKLVLQTHLDHPGMGLKNNHQGILFGSVGYERLQKLLPIDIKIFNKQGEFVGNGKITNLPRSPYFEYKTKAKVERNYTAQYDFPYYKETAKEIHVYNSDNAIDTATMMALLEEKLDPQFNVFYVFNFHEEVHQISAWHLAKNNLLNLSKNDHVLTLESPIIQNQEDKYSKLNYEDGVVLKLSNVNCLFGCQLNNLPNQTETLLRLAAKKIKTPLQVGFAKGSDESRVFSHFKYTANICTLAVPNRYKHNWGENGALVPEMNYKKDINDFYNLLVEAIQTDPKTITDSKLPNLSLRAKRENLIDNSPMTNKKLLNLRLETSTYSIVKRGYFYPENTIDLLTDIFFKTLAFLKYLYFKFS